MEKNTALRHPRSDLQESIPLFVMVVTAEETNDKGRMRMRDEEDEAGMLDLPQGISGGNDPAMGAISLFSLGSHWSTAHSSMLTVLS